MRARSQPSEKARIQRSITFLVWKDALLSWGFPASLLVLMGVAVLAGLVDVIPATAGITFLGWLLLLLLAYFPFRNALSLGGSTKRRRFSVFSAAAWLAVMLSHLYFSIRVGQQLFQSTLEPAQPRNVDRGGQPGKGNEYARFCRCVVQSCRFIGLVVSSGSSIFEVRRAFVARESTLIGQFTLGG